jgi:tetratricopeptide (TPR) repeat protein
MLVIGCARATTPNTAGVSAAPAMVVRGDAALQACEAQAIAVEDALERLADRYLWEEIEALVQAWGAARKVGEATACGQAAEAALLVAARRFAEAGTRSGGSQSYDLAQRAWRALVGNFPGSEQELEYAFGRLDWTRAVRTANELGEQTLAAELYASAQRHHAEALRRGGLRPEQARVAASEQLEAMRRALDYQQTGWSPGPLVCEPDPSGRCATRPSSAVVIPLAPTEAQMLAAFDLYLGEPEAQALPEAPTVAVDRAELLLRHGRLAEAEAGLREVLRAHDGEPVGARAGLLLMRSLQARWQDPAASPAAQAQARAGLISTTQELQRLRAMSLATGPSEELRLSLGRLRGAAMWQAAVAARSSGAFAECARVFDEMAEETGIEGQSEATLRFEAAGCHEAEGAFAAAIAGYDGWLRRFAADRRAAEVELRLARVNERVQNVEDARDHYIRFVALAPGDARASEARRRSIALALVTGSVDAEQVAALTRDRRSGDRLLAAAIRFRTEVRPGSPHARVMGYLQQFGRDGGERRLAIAHLRAAEALMRSSCPAGAVDGLCVEVTRDKTLGRVLPRDKGQVVQARAHLQAAAGFLSVRGADDGLEAPLAVAPGEVAAARQVLSLLLGDLGAEAALSTRPPASYEPTRSRQWFERRVSEVQRMQAVYEGINPAAGRDVAVAVATSAADRFAAVIEARKAQVFEADIGLLEEVSRAIGEQSAAGSDGAALAVTMQRLADARRGEVFDAYHRCIELVALWGDDPERRAESCRAGLGRLVQRHELRLEYVPDLRGGVR